MEDTIRDIIRVIAMIPTLVLILVLMEDTIRDFNYYNYGKEECLNPCFNGRYYQREEITMVTQLTKVLILVLMEDTIRVLSMSVIFFDFVES